MKKTLARLHFAALGPEFIVLATVTQLLCTTRIHVPKIMHFGLETLPELNPRGKTLQPRSIDGVLPTLCVGSPKRSFTPKKSVEPFPCLRGQVDSESR